MRRLIAAFAVSLGLLAGPLAIDAEAAEPEACKSCEALLDLAAAHPSRKADRERDPYRHPVETLKFFRIRPDMKVGEYAPGGGWYSRLLGVYLGGQGRLTGLFFNTRSLPGDDAARQGVRDAAARFPAEVAGWTGQPAGRFAGYTLDAIPEAEKGTFDRVLMMRMMHNLQRVGILRNELVAIRSLLKPDGLLGVEQHRARPDAPADYADGSKGYMRQKDVIALIEAHGFELVGKSEVNANRKDRADHPKGVWELPPVLSTKRKELESVGESDRMTLLFRKRP